MITDLVVRCGAGDRTALDHLVTLFYPAAVAEAAAQVPSDTVDDAVVHGFVEVWRQAARFQQGQHRAVSWVMAQIETGLRAGR